MRVLITGGAGFIGKHLIRRFLGKGHTVICYDTDTVPLHYDSGAEAGVLIRRKGDVTDWPRLLKVAESIEVVVHLVGLADIPTCQKKPMESFRLNLMTLQYVLEACRLLGARLVFPSSAAVYGIPNDLPIKESAPIKPNNTYGYHKWLCEQMIRLYQEAYSLDYVILRLFNVYGEGVKGVIERFIGAAAKEEEFTAFGVSQYRDFIHTKDVAEALYQASVSDKAINKTINIGSGRGTQISELLEIVQELYPAANWKEVKGKLPLYDHIADNTKARLLLDFDPHSGHDFMMKVIKEEILGSATG